MLQESDTRRQWGKVHKTAKRKYAAKKRKIWLRDNMAAIESVILILTILAAAAVCAVLLIMERKGSLEGGAAGLFLEYLAVGAMILGIFLSFKKPGTLPRLAKILLNAAVFCLCGVLYVLRDTLLGPGTVGFLLPAAALVFFFIHIFGGETKRS